MAFLRLRFIASKVCHKNKRFSIETSRRAFLGFPFAFPLAFDRQGHVTASESRTAEGFADALPGAPPLELIQIPSGALLLPNGREARVSAFALGRHEVTVAQWNAVAKLPKRKLTLPVLKTGANSPFGWRPEQAAEMVAFRDCVEFCARLAKFTGRDYRLPSDREWVYACRAGTATQFWWGNVFNPHLVALPKEHEAPKPPASTGFANPFGLFDIIGNVDEWVSDGDPNRTNFHMFHSTPTESDWLSEKFTRTGLGFRVAV
jgi:hypothetical protein